jgi:hypothetical protein
MIANFLLLGVLAASTVELQVQPVSGELVSGSLTSLDSSQLVLKTESDEVAYPVDELFWAIPAGAAPSKAPSAAVWVELTDGSRLLGSAYTVERGLASIRLTNDETAEVRTRSINTVRFKSHENEPALAEQWAKIVGQPNRTSDVVIVRRTLQKKAGSDGSNAAPEFSLDYVDGVLYNITADSVQFEVDGELVPVPRSRVEGLIYYHPQGETLREPLCRVTDAFGTVWSAASLSWDSKSERLAFKTTAGVQGELAADELRRLDFSVGKLQYLSDLEPAAVEFTSRQSGGASDDNYAKLFAFKRDRSLLESGPLLVAGQEYKKGLALTSRTQVTYVLPEGFRRFRATVGIDDRTGGRGNVELVITGDGRELSRHEVDGGGEPIRLDIDISGVRRLTFLADWGKYGDTNDDLDLCEARITK